MVSVLCNLFSSRDDGNLYKYMGLNVFRCRADRIRIFIVPVQVYKEICLTVHSRK